MTASTPFQQALEKLADAAQELGKLQGDAMRAGIAPDAHEEAKLEAAAAAAHRDLVAAFNTILGGEAYQHDRRWIEAAPPAGPTHISGCATEIGGPCNCAPSVAAGGYLLMGPEGVAMAEELRAALEPGELAELPDPVTLQIETVRTAAPLVLRAALGATIGDVARQAAAEVDYRLDGADAFTLQARELVLDPTVSVGRAVLEHGTRLFDLVVTAGGV